MTIIKICTSFVLSCTALSLFNLIPLTWGFSLTGAMSLSTTEPSVWAWWRKLWDMTGCKLMIHLFCKRWNCFCSRWLNWRSEKTSANIVTLCMNTSSNFSVVCRLMKWSLKYVKSFYMKNCTQSKCRVSSRYCQRIKLKTGSSPKGYLIWWDWPNPTSLSKVTFFIYVRNAGFILAGKNHVRNRWQQLSSE